MLLAASANAQIDLAVSFEGPSEYTPGETGYSYTLTITNHGDEDDSGPGITTDFPADATVSWSCTATGSASCGGVLSSGNGNLDRSGDSITIDDSITYDFQVAFDSDLTNDPLVVTATVTDSNDVVTSDEVSSSLSLEADLSVTKSAAGTTYVPGTTVTNAYTIEVSNAGPSDATGVTLTDAAPTGMTIDAWRCVDSGGDDCPSASGAGNINEALAIPAGETFTYTLDASYAADASTNPLVNEASLTVPAVLNDPDGTEGQEHIESDTSSQERDARVDLSAGHQATAPFEYIPGTIGNTYSVQLANAGPSDAQTATVTIEVTADTADDIESFSYSCAQATLCSPASGNMTDDAVITEDENGVLIALELNADLAAGASADLALEFDFSSRALSDPIEISVSIATDTGDTETDTGNDSDSIQLNIDRQADFSIVKTASVSATSPNGEYEYHLEVTNNGPSDVGHGPGNDAILINDAFSGQLNGQASECPGGDGSQPCWRYCASDLGTMADVDPDNCPAEVVTGQGDIADIGLSIEAGNTSTIEVFVSTSSGASGTISNTATAGLATDSPVTESGSSADNESSVTIDVIIGSDISITKGDSALTAVPGSEHNYSIIVSNDGFMGVNDVRVFDQLPVFASNGDAGFISGSIAFQCEAFNGACCNHNSQQCGANGTPTAPETADVLDRNVDLPDGSFVEFTVTGEIHPRATGTLTNTATLTLPADFNDPDETNNTATDDDTVLTPEADLSISKELLSLEPEDGPPFTLTYQIDATNHGPSHVDDATIHDSLTSELIEPDSASWYCQVTNSAGGTECLTTDPDSPSTGAASVVEEVVLGPGGSVRLIISVDTKATAEGEVINTAEINAAAGSDTTTVTSGLKGSADLTISKTSSLSSLAPGLGIEYLITVTNEGPDNVFGATVTDIFPPEIEDVAWQCEATTPVPGDLNFQRTQGVGNVAGHKAVTSVDGNHIYVIASDSNDTGQLFVFDRDPTPGLTFGRIALLETEMNGINDSSDTGSSVSGMDTPIDVMIAPDGHHVYVLSEGSDESDPAIATFERNTNPADPGFGELTFVDRVNEGIPETPRRFAMSGNHLYVSGDEVIAVFARDPALGLPAHDIDHDTGIPPAPGPLAIDRNRQVLFAGSSNSTGLFAYAIEPAGGGNPAGRLSLLDQITDADTDGLADLKLAPDANHLYGVAANAGKLVMIDHTDITDSGTLNLAFEYNDAYVGGTGLIDATTRLDIASDGEHVLLSNNAVGALVRLRRDPVAGGLTGEEVIDHTDAGHSQLENTSGLLITPDGRHVLVVLDNSEDGTLARYSRRAPDPLFAFVEKDSQGDESGSVTGLLAPNDVVTSPDGDHVYAVSLPDNALSVFRRDPASGVTDDTLGEHLQYLTSYFESDTGIDGLLDPRRILISPDGESVYVTSQDNDTLAVFDRNNDDEDPGYGTLSFRTSFTDGEGGIDGLAGAQGMAINPSGRHLYVAGSFDSSIAIFDRDPTDNSLAWRGRVRNGTDGVNGLTGIRDLVVTHDGQQLLGVSTTDNALVVFKRDASLSSPDYGALRILQAREAGIGTRPVALAIPGATARGAGEHVYVTGENSHSIAVLRRVTDPTSSAFGQVQPIEVIGNGDDGISFMSGPRDVVVSPDGKRVYVAAQNDGAVIVFDRDLNEAGESFGRLTRVESRRNDVGGVAGIGQVRALSVSNDSRNVYAAGFGSESIASFLLGTGSLCTAGGGGSISDRVDIGVGGTLVYRARGTVRADASGTLTNTAEVAVPVRFEEIDANDNIAHDIINLVPAGDISVTKSTGAVSVVAGETATYDITITNPGPSNLVHTAGAPLTLNDTLDPDFFEVDSAVWSCEASGSGALTFIEAHLPEDDGGAPGFEAMRGISGMARFAADGTIPVLAAASVIDNAVLIFTLPGFDQLDGSLDAPLIIRDGDAFAGGTVNSLAGARSVAASDDGRFLYVASRIADSVTVFEMIDDNGSLTIDLVEEHDSIIGLDQAVHLILGPDGEHLYVAGSNDDAIAVFGRDAGTGQLTWLESEQHGLSDPDDSGGTVDSLIDVEHLIISPAGDHLYALSGSSGRIAVFDRDAGTGELIWARSYGEDDFGEPLDGAGSAAFDQSGTHLYIAAAAANRIVVLERTGNGELSLASSITQSDEDVSGLSGVRQLILSDDDTHLYATSPIADSVAWFVRDSADGSLRFGGVRANTSALVDGLDGASELLFDADLNQVFVAGTQAPAISRFQRQADSFCPASGTGSIEDMPFDIAAGGSIHVRIEAEVRTDIDGNVTNSAIVTSANDTDLSNNTDEQTNPVDRKADLRITKDDGLRENDGLQGAAAVIGDAEQLYVAGRDDAAIAIFDRNDGSTESGKLTFRAALRDGDAGLTGLNGVADLALDSNAEHLYAAAGGDNTIIVFDRGADGGLEPAQVLQNGIDGVSGLSGARSIAVSPDDAHVYVASAFSNAVVALTRTDNPGDGSHGQLEFLHVLENGVNSVAGLAGPVALAIAPDGRQVYVLGREDNTLTVLRRETSTGSANLGRLTYVTHYTEGLDGIAGLSGVRDLVISDDGAYLYVLGDADGTLAVFERDSTSGELTCVENIDGDCFFRQDGFGDTTGLANASALRFSPSGEELYVAGDGSLSRYAIDPDDRTPHFVDQISNGDPSSLTGGEVFGLDGSSDLMISADGLQLYATSTESHALITFERGTAAPGELEFRDIIIDGLGGVAPGEDVVYTIVVENDGPSDVFDATVTDEFPEQFEQVSWTCTSAGGAECPGSGNGDLNTVVELPVGGRVTFSAGGLIKDNATGRLINTASVSAGGILDPDPSDNEATDDDTILAPSMDLVVTVDDGTDEVTPGLSTTYEVKVRNLGPSYARGIRLEDQLPAALFDAAWQCLPQPRAGVLEAPEATDPALTGYRDAVFAGNGRHAYVSGHDNGTAAISVFRRNGISGGLELEQTLRQGFDGVIGLQGVEGLALRPDGRFLYAAAKDADGIAIFERDATTGQLAFTDFVQDGTTGIEGLGGVSRLLFSSDGAWLYAISGADQALVTFAVDEGNGTLTQADVLRNGDDLPDSGGVLDGLNGASAMAWSQDGDYLLIAARTNESLAAFRRNAASGMLEHAAVVLSSGLGNGALADPVALQVTESDEIFVASRASDRIDRFEFTLGEDDDPPQFVFLEALSAATLGVAALSAPGDLDYDPDRRRLYIQHDNAITLVSLMRPDVEAVVQYGSSDHALLDGVAALALGPDSQQLYSLGTELGVWSRKRGSRCDVLGDGALGRQEADISAGGEVVYEVSARIQANATGEIRYNAEAEAPLPEQELNAEDNLDVDINVLVPAPDLAAVKSATPAPVVAGEDIRFRIDLTNAGPSDALETVLFDEPPIHPAVTGGLLAETGAWSCQANPPLDIPGSYAGDDPLTDLVVGTNGIYATSDDTDAVIIRTRDNGTIGPATVIHDGDIVAGETVVGLDGASAVAVSADERHLYVTGRNDNSLVVFTRDDTGDEFSYLQTLESGVAGVFGLLQPQGVMISDDGGFVYTTSDPPAPAKPAIAVFARDELTGELEYIERYADGLGTIEPESNVLYGLRDVLVSRSGTDLFSVAADSNTLSHFRRNPEDGTLVFENVWRDGDSSGELTIPMDGARALAASPADQHLYVLGEFGLARFDRDDQGNLDFADSWMEIPDLGMPRSIHIDPAGTRLYLLDDAAIHVFARDWENGDLEHRNRIELAGGSTLFGDSGSSLLWVSSGTELLAYPELALSRCLQAGAISDFIDLDLELGAGGYSEVIHDATVHPSARGELINSASVFPELGVDPFTDNNFSESATDIEVVSDIAITKSGPAEAVAGETIAYQFVVTNAGPSDALGIGVIDFTDPADALLDPEWSCTASGDSQCPATSDGSDFTADLLVGDELVIEVVATVDPSVVGEMTNTAELIPEVDASDPTTDDHSSSVTTEVEAIADVAVTKTLVGDAPVAGDTVTWTIGIANTGPSDAPEVAIADTLDTRLSNIEWTCIGSDGGQCPVSGAGDLDFTAALPAGSGILVTVTGVLPSAASGTLDNSVTVTVAEPAGDPDNSNNQSATSDVIAIRPDLAMGIIAPFDPFDPDGQLDLPLTLTVDNLGPSDATDALVEFGFDAATTVDSGGACIESSGNWQCQVGALAAGDTFQIDLTVSGLPAAGEDLTVDALVSTTDDDPNPGNNSAQRIISLVNGPDITVNIDNDTNQVRLNDWVTYTITVANAGSVQADGIEVSVPVSQDLIDAEWECQADADVTCQASGTGDVIDTIDLGPGDIATYTLSARVDPELVPDPDPPHKVTQSAQATLADDINATNNTDTDTDPVELTLFRDRFEAPANGGTQ